MKCQHSLCHLEDVAVLLGEESTKETQVVRIDCLNVQHH